MSYVKAENIVSVRTFYDGKNAINTYFKVLDIDTADGETRVSFLFENNGAMWTADVRNMWNATPASEVVNGFKSFMRFRSCANDPARKRPPSATCERVLSLIKDDMEKNAAAYVAALEKAVAQARAIVGAGDGGAARIAALEKAMSDERAAWDAERAALKADAGKADVNALIMSSVVDALTPSICERIKERVGVLADAVPTRLEVVINDAVHTTGAAVRHEKFEQVLKALVCGFPVWLMGDAGTGKSVMCEQIADALDAEYYYSGAVLDEYALKGFIDANGRKHGTAFTSALDAAAAGRDVVFCMDECDGSTPEVLLILNNLLSGGAVECMGTTYRLNEHMHIVACGNTNGRGGDTRYTRSIIDAATLDRFYLVDVDYSPAVELISAGGDEQLARFARRVRDVAKTNGLDLLVTYRAIKRLAKLAPVVGYADALRGGLLRGLDTSDVITLSRSLQGDFGPWSRALSDVVTATA